MASLIVAGDTSGSVTIAAPAVASTPTLTLPTVSGTFITTASSGQSIPKAALPTGSVLQVVQATYSTNSFNSTGSLADSGLTATITPTSSSSGILVLVNQAGVVPQSSLNGVTLALLRNSTSILNFGFYIGYSLADMITNASSSFLDFPATTSATIYKTQFCRTTGSGQVIVQANGAVSTIILMEIAA